MNAARRITLEARNESLQLAAPFPHSGYVFEHVPVTLATLHDGVPRNGVPRGRGEAAGVYYLGDQPEGMLATIEALRGEIEAGLDRQALQSLLPAGGARNALDGGSAVGTRGATRRAAGVAAGIDAPRPLLTTSPWAPTRPGRRWRVARKRSTAHARSSSS